MKSCIRPCNETKSKYVSEELFKYKYLFDFSEYKTKFFDWTNKKVVGKMKHEFKIILVNKFTGLKWKMLCIVSANGEEVNTAKEVNILTKFKKYENVLVNKTLPSHKIRRIQSKLHKTSIYHVFKISLSCFNDKRYSLNDGITTLVYCHKDLKD